MYFVIIKIRRTIHDYSKFESPDEEIIETYGLAEIELSDSASITCPNGKKINVGFSIKKYIERTEHFPDYIFQSKTFGGMLDFLENRMFDTFKPLEFNDCESAILYFKLNFNEFSY